MKCLVLTLKAGKLEKRAKIVQKQLDALTLTSDKFEVAATGGEIQVEVKANVAYEVEIAEDAKGWISQISTSRGLKASTIEFVIAESQDVEKREGLINIKSGELKETIHVYQSGQQILLLSENTCRVSSEQQTIKVELKSNFDFEVDMPAVDWLSAGDASRGVSSHTLYYTIQANETFEVREADIIFHDAADKISNTLHVIQEAKSGLSVDQHAITAGCNGQEFALKVSHNVEYQVAIDSDWIIEQPTRSLKEDLLTFAVQRNNATTKREGKITLTSKDGKLTQVVTITQSGQPEEPGIPDNPDVPDNDGEVGGSGEDIPFE